jgi:drug/metabolite transporter (DMT)-like permease
MLRKQFLALVLLGAVAWFWLNPRLDVLALFLLNAGVIFTMWFLPGGVIHDVNRLMLPAWPMPGVIGPVGWLALGFLGLSSGLAHCVYARAYALAPVSALAPYEYTMLPWGVAAGFLMFGDLPSWNTLLGAAVVAASGSYNVYRERVRRAEERAAA